MRLTMIMQMMSTENDTEETHWIQTGYAMKSLPMKEMVHINKIQLEELIQKKGTAVKGEGAAAVTWTVRDNVPANSAVKEELIQMKVTSVKGEGAAAVTWTVRDGVPANSAVKEELWKQVGVKGFNFRNKPIKAGGNNNRINFL